MPSGEYTNGDAFNIIENEGAGYAVQHYCDGEEFKDPETTRLWNEAGTALENLVTYLERETGREF